MKTYKKKYSELENKYFDSIRENNSLNKMEMKINENDSVEIVFADGEKTAIASIPYHKLKELILDYAYEKITTPECSCSSCAVNGFCECDPVNEDMEYVGIYLCVGK